MQIHVPLIDKRTGQIISMTGSEIQVMDSETFETVDIQMVDEEVDGKLEQAQDIEYWNVMGRTKIMRIKSS
uniref:Translation initiation factor eIF-5A n=1 Tax=uncultured marine thaumarchaeote KM3_03_D08 TaxID=1455960 RepID=A0A075G821_9ARCH|nr:translation initiation factor eIF-5A [uncultured marine thaumarchaeote KM3_03_D08]